ncbi:8782_t:CDS:2 [Cetraspora pellucida]|uniref:8782_t:CDS:1 n=1 Tax=Cetraspora pellucida TaxID=1433469 RepID=A0A9N9IPY3_9GLOM|nr:8782_t:CDS:2 [Cetraspora pellucida]
MSDDIRSDVEKVIAENHVVIFSKSYCPYCNRAKQTLDQLGTNYVAWELDNMDDGPAVQNYLSEKTGQRTVPNIFIRQQSIGGNDKLQALLQAGKLKELLKPARI